MPINETLKDFLKIQAEEKISELIIFLSEQAKEIKKGFYFRPERKQSIENTVNIYGEEQMDLDKWADKGITTIRV